MLGSGIFIDNVLLASMKVEEVGTTQFGVTNRNRK